VVIYSPNKGRTYFDHRANRLWSARTGAHTPLHLLAAIQEIAPLGLAAGERYNAAMLGLLNG
jgi:hypothetical protein